MVRPKEPKMLNAKKSDTLLLGMLNNIVCDELI